ncbi:RNA N6-adenosine-methyltransferase METTL16 [Belonocnema kinseyi]|uniref:RNA N6-adenosine-methyltransferase METTL16 n=1 Tax=Belonocnema kinseyi TaxID=2817044 RepID=UPI00143D8666|nr:RNA N6-adenosine-methyltransferase METTL16 [Belonocnema kinseyi]
MISSEVDPQSVKSANDNIQRNKMQDLIKVVSVLKETILAELLDEKENYSFVMCNPPFFKAEGDSEKTPKRLPPRNAPTGNKSELVVEGGEIAFIMKLIDDSILLQERVQIYTTMIGLKTSLVFLKSELKSRNIANATWTEFCQGFTKRWGLAWTFLPTNILDLSTAPTMRMKPEILERKKRERPPSEIIFPPHSKFGTVQDVVEALKFSLRDLNIEAKELNLEGKEHPYWAGELRACEDSWSHARKRRREFLQKEDSVKKAHRETENKIKADSSNPVTIPETTYGFRHCQSKEPLLVFILVVDAVHMENKSQEGNEISLWTKHTKIICFLDT